MYAISEEDIACSLSSCIPCIVSGIPRWQCTTKLIARLITMTYRQYVTLHIAVSVSLWHQDGSRDGWIDP